MIAKKFGKSRTKVIVVLLFSFAVLLATLLWSIGTGSIPIPPGTITDVFTSKLGFRIWGSATPQDELVVMSLRLPRALLAVIVGGALAVSGASLQGLFRNPLADPQFIGISSGAALGAIVSIVAGSVIFESVPHAYRVYMLPLSAFAGGFAATLIVYRIATRNGKTFVGTLLLAGLAVNAVCSSIFGVFIFLAKDAQLREITFWTLGSINGASWQNVGTALPFILLPMLVLVFLGNKLNLLSLGEKEAYYAGVNVQRVKTAVIILVAFSVGSSVASCGIISFVGLLVPHIIRLLFGPDYRYILSGSVLLGGAMLLAADTIARTIVTPAELPIGILTTAIGGPFFLWLLMREKKAEHL